MSEFLGHTPGPWGWGSAGFNDVALSTKEEFLRYCEECWDKTEAHGERQEHVFVVQDETGDMICIVGNGPKQEPNSNLIAALRAAWERERDLQTECDWRDQEIANLKARERWIPVEERLPEGVITSGKEWVLIKYVHHLDESHRDAGAVNYVKARWRLGDEEWETVDRYRIAMRHVTHWREIHGPKEGI